MARAEVREHRGRRLGLLVEVAALRALVDRSPATRSVSTWIDGALGSGPDRRLPSWRRALDA